MVRVLQLISRGADAPGLHGLRGSVILADNPTDHFGSFSSTIGCGGDFRNAGEAAVRLRFGHEFNLIHAWDPPALIAAIISGLPVAFSGVEALSPGTWSWLAAMACTEVHVVADSARARRKHLRAGIPSGRCHVIPPGIDFNRIKGDRDQQLRQELGLSADDRVILAPGESTQAAGHKLALHAVSILHVLDERHRLLIWGPGRQAKALASLGRRLRQPRLVIDAQRRLGRRVEFEQLLCAADMALVTPNDSAPVLPMALCGAAGLPVVAVATPLVREVFTDRTAALVPPHSPRLLAQRMLELFEDPRQAKTLGLESQAAIRRNFDEKSFIARHHDLYSHIAAGYRAPGPRLAASIVLASGATP